MTFSLMTIAPAVISPTIKSESGGYDWILFQGRVRVRVGVLVMINIGSRWSKCPGTKWPIIHQQQCQMVFELAISILFILFFIIVCFIDSNTIKA